MDVVKTQRGKEEVDAGEEADGVRVGKGNSVFCFEEEFEEVDTVEQVECT